MKKIIPVFLITFLQLAALVSSAGAQTVLRSSFTVSDSVICVGDCVSFTDRSTGNPLIWNWQFGGGIPHTSTAQNPPYVCYDTAGTYTVILLVENDNQQNAIQKFHYITVQLCTGANNIETPGGPNIYPNPFTDNLTIQLNAEYQQGLIVMYDVLGRPVCQNQPGTDHTFKINTENYPLGFYLVRIINPDGKSITKRLIKAAN